VHAGADAGNALREFLRYLHYRDHIQRGDEGRGVAGLVRYVAHRDQAAPQGRLFTRERNIGDSERNALVAFVRRSLAGVPAHLLDGRRLPAAYRFVLGPEDPRGLDLRRLTNQIMRQLEHDAGDLPPWIAAEHRNTAHGHIHVVLAARREIAPGQFRAVVINRPRLARMKAAMVHEIARQRGDLPRSFLRAPELADGKKRRTRQGLARGRGPQSPSPRMRRARRDPLRWRSPLARTRPIRVLSWYPMQRAFARLAAYYRKELEREEREAMRRWRLSGRDRYEEYEREGYE
jgi:hypothetical protein